MGLTKEEKLQKAKAAKEIIEKDFGKNTVMSLNEKQQADLEVVSTGSFTLNKALGIKGLPKGRIVEIYGPESSGKTTIAMHVIAEAQKKGGLCAFIDAEHAFDKEYAINLGININELDINQPDNGEQGLEIADKLAQSGAYDVIVIDSVAALVPKAELEDPMGTSKMGLHARLMSQALRKITGTAYKSGTMIIFINQLRDKIGVMFGNPETTTGGNALKFYASVRLDVRRSTTEGNSTFNESGDKTGNLTKVTVVKNKTSPPFKKAEFDIIYGKGIDKIGEILNAAIKSKLIRKWGDTYTYEDTKYKADEITTLLQDNEEFYNELVRKLDED